MVMEILRKKTMIRNQLLVIIFLLMIGIFYACEKEANVKIPETEPKPVLVCFISPEDSLIRVSLTNSIPLYTSNANNYPYEINNAIITISNGNLSKKIPWFKDSIGYQLSTSLFPIIAGETYSIEVEIPDGRKLNAKTKVPNESFPLFDFTIDKNLIDSNEFGVNYEFIYTLSWTDLPAVTNYYRAVIYNLTSDTNLGVDKSAQPLNEIFESDQGKDGETIKITGQGSIFYDPGSTPFSDSNYIAYLIMSNKEYFEYHKDLYYNNDGNPFSEAKINFSNIEGGIGCFSAYRMVKKRF